MLAFISDANILIDVEVGGLLAPMFSFQSQRGVMAIQHPRSPYFQAFHPHPNLYPRPSSGKP